MIVTLAVPQESDPQAIERRFLEMLPCIRRVASFAFRRLRRTLREDLIAEVLANALAASSGQVKKR
jgi:hypothetical protein